MEKELHVILGTGPAGCWTARALVDRGLSVRAVNRSGKRPELMPAEVEMSAANVSDAAQAIAAAEGATTVYQALNPEYHQWHEFFPGLQAGALAAAKAAGAVYVSIENLYMYDSSDVMSEAALIAPVSKKGTLRQHMAEEVMAAHERGEIRAVALRSSDYYGPGVTGSAFGDMVFGNLVAGKKAQVSGSLSKPHSFAYIEDVGRAAAELGVRDDVLGRVWIAPHAPAQTQGQMVEAACRLLGVPMKATGISPMMMRLAGLFIPQAKAGVEMMYEFTKPFVVDSGRIEIELGLKPTPIEKGLSQTVDWYVRRAGKVD
ncbi:MAG: NAD-dependent epimerase/dehydratase family protein [Coriobacteriia bacterium]